MNTEVLVLICLKILCVVKTNVEISHMGTQLGYISSSVTTFVGETLQNQCSVQACREEEKSAWKQTNNKHMFMLLTSQYGN